MELAKKTYDLFKKEIALEEIGLTQTFRKRLSRVPNTSGIKEKRDEASQKER